MIVTMCSFEDSQSRRTDQRLALLRMMIEKKGTVKPVENESALYDPKNSDDTGPKNEHFTLLR